MQHLQYYGAIYTLDDVKHRMFWLCGCGFIDMVASGIISPITSPVHMLAKLNSIALNFSRVYISRKVLYAETIMSVTMSPMGREQYQENTA